MSFKIKVCLVQDANGKQIFKCTTWYPSADLTPAKARKEAQKVAMLWEDEARQHLFSCLQPSASCAIIGSKQAGGTPHEGLNLHRTQKIRTHGQA